MKKSKIVSIDIELEEFEPIHLTLATRAGDRGERLFGRIRCTYWARPGSTQHTRLLVKLRIAPGRRRWSHLARIALAWGDLVMMRRQLKNLKALAELK